MENVEYPVEVGTREFWRLGHRRRWWQWNVRTLFGGLFSLVWARELFNMTQTNTWMTCVLVVALWAFAPLLFIPSKVIGPIGIVRAVCGVTGVLILLFISMEVPLEISLLSIPAAFLLAVMIGARHP